MVSNIFYFHPYLGKIPILTNIFQMGWNHQLDKVCFDSTKKTGCCFSSQYVSCILFLAQDWQTLGLQVGSPCPCCCCCCCCCWCWCWCCCCWCWCWLQRQHVSRQLPAASGGQERSIHCLTGNDADCPSEKPPLVQRCYRQAQRGNRLEWFTPNLEMYKRKSSKIFGIFCWWNMNNY